MRSMKLLAAASVASIAVAWAGSALADMTGTYTGYGDGAGTTLDIEQAGNDLNGIVAGVVEGVLLGETDGGDNATGVVLIFDIAKLPFTGVFTGTELQLTLTGVNGELTLVPFALDGATPAPAPTPTPSTKPAPQPTPVEPAPDHATVTEALRTLLVALVGVEFGDRTAEFQAGVVECLIGVTAPLPAAELQALVAAGFEPTDEMIAQFERTVPGIDAAVSTCFTAADAPPEPVTAPAKPAPTPAPQPPPTAPVAPDDAAVDADLRAVLVEVVAEVLPPDATPERRAETAECLFLAAAGLPTAERQHLADIGFDPDEEDIARLETLLPGITEAVGTCLGFD